MLLLQGQVVNAVVDNTGQVLNYSTNPGGQTIVRQVGGQVQQVVQQPHRTEVVVAAHCLRPELRQDLLAQHVGHRCWRSCLPSPTPLAQAVA